MEIGTDRTTHIRINDVMNIGNVDGGTITVETLPTYVEYTEGIESGTLFFTQSIVQDKLVFGKPTASRFECRLHIDEDITGKEITVWQTDNDDNTRYIFNGIVDSAKLNRGEYYRDVIAYDKFYTLSGRDVADWWLDIWEQHIITSRTFYHVREALFDLIGIQWDSTFTASVALTYNKAMKFTKISATMLLQYLTAPFFAIPYIRPTGSITFILQSDPTESVTFKGLSKIEFCTFSDTELLNITNKYEQENSSFADVVSIPPIGIKFLNEDGSVLIRRPNPPFTDNDRELDFPYNPLLTGVSSNNLKNIANKCWDNLDRLYTFCPGRVKLIISDLDIPLGKLLQIVLRPPTFDDPTGEYIFTYNFETTLSGPLLIEQEIACDANSDPFASGVDDTTLDSRVGVEDTIPTDIDNLQTDVSDLQDAISYAVQSVSEERTHYITIGNLLIQWGVVVIPAENFTQSTDAYGRTVYKTTATVELPEDYKDTDFAISTSATTSIPETVNTDHYNAIVSQFDIRVSRPNAAETGIRWLTIGEAPST